MNWREHIQNAIDESDGKWSIEAIEERLDAGTAQLVETGRSAAVVWVETFPARTALVIAFGGGDLGDILGNIPFMMELARENECDVIDIYGRPGWERVLKKHGFRHSATVMSIEV